jgi:hypothetical protein
LSRVVLSYLRGSIEPALAPQVLALAPQVLALAPQVPLLQALQLVPLEERPRVVAEGAVEARLKVQRNFLWMRVSVQS